MVPQVAAPLSLCSIISIKFIFQFFSCIVLVVSCNYMCSTVQQPSRNVQEKSSSNMIISTLKENAIKLHTIVIFNIKIYTNNSTYVVVVIKFPVLSSFKQWQTLSFIYKISNTFLDNYFAMQLALFKINHQVMFGYFSVDSIFFYIIFRYSIIPNLANLILCNQKLHYV